MALQPSWDVNTNEARLLKVISKQLVQKGFRILGKNQRLFNIESTKEQIAEFDLICRDPQGRLSLIEVKHKLEDTNRVERQFERLARYLQGESPFEDAVGRVIIISLPAPQNIVSRWKAQGLEFFQFFGEKIHEN